MQYVTRLTTALAAAGALVPTHTECKIDPMRNNSPQKLPRYGKACARLYVGGTRRVSQCHNITK